MSGEPKLTIVDEATGHLVHELSRTQARDVALALVEAAQVWSDVLGRGASTTPPVAMRRRIATVRGLARSILSHSDIKGPSV